MEYAAPKDLTSWLECLFFAAALAAALIHLVRVMRGPAATPANESIAVELKAIKERIGKMEDSEAITRIHQRLDEIISKVAELRGEINILTKDIFSLPAKQR